MSNHEGPSRRRRIAGESKPSDARVPTPAKKVVRRPVARPGVPAESPSAEHPAAETSPVEQTQVDEALVETAPAEPEAPEADPAGTDPAEPRSREAAPAPRAPRVGRRPARAGAGGVVADPESGGRADADDPVVAVDEPGQEGRRRPPLGRLLLVAVVVAAIAFGAVFGYRGVAEYRQTHGVDGAHEQAAESAASAAETIFTYRYDRLEQYLEDSKDVMTPSFAEDFETISPALNDLAPQRQIQVQATTRDSAPVGCGDDCRRDEATVLLFVDQARLADGSEVPTVFGNRVELTMVERDGRWLVDDIKAV